MSQRKQRGISEGCCRAGVGEQQSWGAGVGTGSVGWGPLGWEMGGAARQWVVLEEPGEGL